ncbi:hypothetical protein ASE31_28480 [Acidovorax sp. Root217]|nr:hypothetical protein ASE31_28480 [Acidovorax sp. Root217]
MMPCSRLLKSCAMPPVSWPTASIFCAWRSASSCRRSCWLRSATCDSSVALSVCSATSALRRSSISRWAASNRRALSMAMAASAASRATERSERSVNTPGCAWPKNRPPITWRARSTTGTAR